jgi:hypothetical protein
LHAGHDGIAVVFQRPATRDDEREYARLFLLAALAEWADNDDERIVIEEMRRGAQNRIEPACPIIPFCASRRVARSAWLVPKHRAQHAKALQLQRKW